MAEPASIIKFASWLGRAIGSSSSVFEDFSTEFLGTDLPLSVLDNEGVKTALQVTSQSAEAVETASDELATTGLSGNTMEITTKFILWGNALREYFQSIATLVSAFDNAINSSTIPDADGRAAAENLKSHLTKILVDYIVLTAAEYVNNQLLLLLKVLGLIDWGYTPPENTNGLDKGYVKKELRFDRFKDLINDPVRHFEDIIGWGTDDFDPTPFFRIFTEFMGREESFSLDEIDGDPVLQYGIMSLRSVSADSPTSLQLDLDVTLEKTEEIRRTLTKTLGLTFSTTLTVNGGASMKISPPMDLSIQPTAGEVSGLFKLFVNRHEFARPFEIINGGLINLSVNDHIFGVGIQANWNALEGKASAQPMIFSELSKVTLTIGASDSDGFIGNLLADSDIKAEFDVGFEWIADEGLRIKASGGIEIALPIHKKLAFIEISTIYLALSIKENGTLALEASSGFNGNLGPLTASVERIGTLANLKFSGDNSSDLGLFDFDMKFKPPNGVGLAIDAGVVVGGGYLYFDFEKEEYAGVLELTFSDFLSLKAIGLITTRMPDGSKGFSLLVIVTAEFTIQLGYGFVFLGAGGLLGLNRTMKLEPLAEGVRTGAATNVMFPSNIVENAPKIISDLRIFFPVEEDKFLIGPLAKLGWGTPTLISITLGIVIEIRVDDSGGIERIAILGVLKCILPDEEAALLVLQVNFIGAIDFQKKNAFFFASIFDSRVLFITLEGEMGVLVAWSEDSNFVVSVGGFHPRFNPPPLPFPVPKRVSLNILNESWGKIRVQGYFAVTTNTVQLGTKLELYFGFSAFKIEGHLAFDALFQFDPFYFIVELSGKVSLKVFGAGLFSISLKLSLEGTSPWRAKGYGKIKILFFSFKARFDETWGESKNTELPPIEIIPLLEKELKKVRNWQAITPKSNNLLVSLRDLPESEETLALHPVGSLRVSQRAIPLRIHLDQVGNQKPEDANKLDFEAAGSLEKIGDIRESFARAQFQEMKDSKKLSSPAYEKEVGGLELSVAGDQTRFGKLTVRHVRYELITIDTAYKRFRERFFNWLGVLFVHFFANNAARRSSLSQRVKKEFQPFDDKIKVRDGAYTVAFNKNNKPYDVEAANFESLAGAEEYMNDLIVENPAMADSLHTIPNNEVNMTP